MKSLNKYLKNLREKFKNSYESMEELDE